jgi:hypothetical protein
VGVNCAAVIPRAALDQLVAVADDLEDVRVAEGLSLRDAGRILGMNFSNVCGLRARASSTLPLLKKYARLLGFRCGCRWLGSGD